MLAVGRSNGSNIHICSLPERRLPVPLAPRLRIHVPDGWYHMMSRGNGWEVLYRTDEDRRRFLGRVAELPEHHGTEVHAFVLMDNHYHLLVR